MNVILYMAVSADGKTTGNRGDVSWVEASDVERMNQCMHECGVMLMGSKTYDDFGDDLPNNQALQVVRTTQEKLLKKKQENVVFSDLPPAEVLALLETKGFSSVLLAGGESLNSSFAKEHLINEIRVIIKPIILGAGKQLFSQLSERITLSLQKSLPLSDGSIELQYSVIW